MKMLRDLGGQFLRFGLIGIICFAIDYGLMIVLTELAGIEYIYSNAISFTLSTIFNYLLSIRYVFRIKENVNHTAELLFFVLLGLIGLGFNQLIMWVVVEHYHVPYQLTKLIATAMVGVYNFITRKVLLEP